MLLFVSSEDVAVELSVTGNILLNFVIFIKVWLAAACDCEDLAWSEQSNDNTAILTNDVIKLGPQNAVEDCVSKKKVSQEKQSRTNEPMGDEFFDLNSEN